MASASVGMRVGSTFRVVGSMSTKAGVAPTYSAQFALAANDKGDVTTTSPGPSSAETAAPCNAAVPLEKATAYCAPVAAQSASSNASTAGPCVSQSPRRTSTTAAMSSPSID